MRRRLRAVVLAAALGGGALLGYQAAARPPGRGGCGPSTACTTGVAARKLAAKKSSRKLGCPVLLDAAALESDDGKSGLPTSRPPNFRFDEVATAKKQKSQAGACCYTWQNVCRGRPARDRGTVRVARVHSGTAWS